MRLVQHRCGTAQAKIRRGPSRVIGTEKADEARHPGRHCRGNQRIVRLKQLVENLQSQDGGDVGHFSRVPAERLSRHYANAFGQDEQGKLPGAVKRWQF